MLVTCSCRRSFYAYKICSCSLFVMLLLLLLLLVMVVVAVAVAIAVASMVVVVVLVVILFTYSSSVSAFCVLMPLFRWLTLLLCCSVFFCLPQNWSHQLIFVNFFLLFFALVRFVLRQHKLVYSMVYNVYACLLVIINERMRRVQNKKKQLQQQYPLKDGVQMEAKTVQNMSKQCFYAFSLELS